MALSSLPMSEAFGVPMLAISFKSIVPNEFAWPCGPDDFSLIIYLFDKSLPLALACSRFPTHAHTDFTYDTRTAPFPKSRNDISPSQSAPFIFRAPLVREGPNISRRFSKNASTKARLPSATPSVR